MFTKLVEGGQVRLFIYAEAMKNILHRRDSNLGRLVDSISVGLFRSQLRRWPNEIVSASAGHFLSPFRSMDSLHTKSI